MSETETQGNMFPRDNLLRALMAVPDADVLELRQEDSGSGMPTMVGEFAVFNQWAEINSAYEGRFMEQIAPGAFSKTFKENRDRMRVLFQHGKDPQVADKPLGPISALGESDTGAYYEVPLLDAAYVRDLIPGLQAGLYGSSFRFQVMQEEIVQKPDRSKTNPEQLPERTIKEAKVMEFGPVTFPAYPGTSSGLRSATDWWLEHSLLSVAEALAGRAAALPDEPEPMPEPVQMSRRTRSRTYLQQPRKERKAWELP